VRDGVTGLLFRHGSVEALSERLKQLAADAPLAARLGRAAYDWYWADPWTAERHVDDLLDHYQSLVATEIEPSRGPKAGGRRSETFEMARDRRARRSGAVTR
jgi:hypothetical protein